MPSIRHFVQPVAKESPTRLTTHPPLHSPLSPLLSPHLTLLLSLQPPELAIDLEQLFGGAEGLSTTPAGKRSTVAAVSDALKQSQMLLSIPSEGITVSQSTRLRNAMPEGTTIKVVKNTLMRRVVETDEDWKDSASLLKGTNMWFFVGDDISGSLSALTDFIKKEGLKDAVSIKGGVIEKNFVNTEQCVAISKIPPKKELIAQIAGGIKGVTTKLARVIKEPNSKLARAIKLASETKS